jgi:3-deoxy-D-manno-octulosonic-acid transferase
MFLFYNLFSFCFALLLLPLLPFIVSHKKYRQRILQRLGIGLAGQMTQLTPRHSSAPTIWIHALSVGEVTSALPLIRGIREHFVEARIIFSATTRSGNQVAQHLLKPYADALIAGPIDWGPVVPYYIQTLKPDLFILVETDFWPNWLHCLAHKRIPLFLVNGRISAQSFARYRRYGLFFRPMFQSFTLLSMQTASDADKMGTLGINPEKILTLGNLKFDTSQVVDVQGNGSTSGVTKKRYGFDETAPLWICGSTHRGEETLIMEVFTQLRATVPGLQLLIAPRNIERAPEIVTLADTAGIDCRTWRNSKHNRGPLLILDTIGELADCYRMAEIVFIGGSLVAEGGHNPIEPAVAGVPVLFGPHMEDFAEIATLLVQKGGGRRVESAASLLAVLQQLFTDTDQRQSMARAAADCVRANRGVVRNHLETIKELLARTGADR